RAVDDLGAVERERAYRLWVLSVGAADCADIADVVRAQHWVERVDSVAKQLHPAVVNVMRDTRALAAPEVVLRRLVDNLTLPRDDEQGVEEAMVDHLRPARLALGHDVRIVLPGERGEPVCLRAWDVDEQVAGCR